MSRVGFKSMVFHGDVCLGEIDTVPMRDQNFNFPNNEIRIHHISSISERCPPISILQTISSFSVRCKLESSTPMEKSHLIDLHSSCFYELKTAVVLLGDEEIHLVAMPSKMKKFPCFWCYAVPLGLYSYCLGMLNKRCLAIVFDLDETLIVANTMKSFEDRIETVRSWISRETDPMRIAGMSSEMRRYMDDRALLKQYIDSDCVVDNGKVYKVQLEEVTPVSSSHEMIVRPVIRLPERNTVLTRINPGIRDTSVLVKLRPAWEDLRSYLTAKGRKRFEVYVCTMAERDYALEIWRLLDPGAHLINTNNLMDRVVCVKSDSRKSLLNVFKGGICHPKMAMVIDDRSKVWEEVDQPRVHVVPAFSPYYAPQAEMANAVPVLCVARNVACNVRGYFFKEFDENLLRRISEIFYEDEVVNLPPAPDVSNYLMSEDASFVPNTNGSAPIYEGMNGPETERMLSQPVERSIVNTAISSTINKPELRSETSEPAVAVTPNIVGPATSTAPVPSQKPSLLGVPGKLLTGKLGVGVDFRNQNSGQPPLLSRFPTRLLSPIPSPRILVEEDTKRLQHNNRTAEFVKEFKPRVIHNASRPSVTSPKVGVRPSQAKSEEASAGHEVPKQSLPQASLVSEAGVSENHASPNNREAQNETGKSVLLSHSSIAVLLEIGRRCSSKVEFKTVLSTSKDLEFSVEALFTGEKIGVGVGKTRKDAQQQAAEDALRSLADKYVAYIRPRSGDVIKDFNKLSTGNDNGFLWESVNIGSSKQDESIEEDTPEGPEVERVTSTSSKLMNHQVDNGANSQRSLQHSREELSGDLQIPLQLKKQKTVHRAS